MNIFIQIIHLDGVQARMPKLSNFNNGNDPYELLIRNNTVISNLGKYTLNNTSDKPTPVKLYDVLNVSGNISKLLSLLYLYLYSYIYFHIYKLSHFNLLLYTVISIKNNGFKKKMLCKIERFLDKRII